MSKAKTEIPTASRDLAIKLMEDANRFCELSKRDDEEGHELLRTGLSYARQSGDRLHEAKRNVPHGEWESFAREHFKWKDATRTNYMQIAEHWDEKIAPALKKNKYLSINEALSLVRRKAKPATPKPDPSDLRQAYKAFKELTDEEIKFCAKYPEIIREAIREIVKVELPKMIELDQRLKNELQSTNESVSA